MPDEDIWSGYYNQLNSKEGSIVDTINYLSNNEDKNLLEISTVNIKDAFPVNKIITLIYNEDFLKGKKLNEKIEILQKIFEILFGYSKKLLLKFDIYRDKYISIKTFQIVHYLSELPDYSNYLSLIGYEFYENNKEWRVSENILSNEKRKILQYLTVCCALGYDYWNDCLKYLFLTIFTNQRLSIEKLMNEQKCEFCDFELDKSKYRCTVCLTEVNKMSFYRRWQSQPVLTGSYHSLNIIKENSKNERKFSSLSNTKSNSVLCTHSDNEFCNKYCSDYKLNHNNLWTCECSFVNQIGQVNCSMCYSTRKNINFNENVLTDKSNFVDLPLNLNKINDTVKDEPKKPMKLHESNDNEDEWKCDFCKTENKINSVNCSNCFQRKPNKIFIGDYGSSQMVNDENNDMKNQNHKSNSNLNKSNVVIKDEPIKLCDENLSNDSYDSSKVMIPADLTLNESLSSKDEDEGLYVKIIKWILNFYSWCFNKY